MEVPKRSVENSCNDYNCLLSDPGEQLVISGVAGRFPDCDNVKIFQEKLFNKVDLISDDDRRWKLDHPEIPQRTGKINNISKFDASFFGVHFKQAHTMDPMCRMLLEHAYEAVVDAGINPRQLRGSKTGVFIGACFSESEKTWFYEKLQVNGFGITGCSRAMLANRISYWLGLTGPSYAIDSACSSSLFAMEQAYRAIRDGLCDAAIVGGSNLCLHPYVSLQFSRLGVLSPDGACKSFDSEANGYARSESICIVYIQKAKHAKRIYATLIHTKTNCDGFKEQGITFPSSQMQGVLLDEFYKECGLPTTCLSYMEAHGTGTKVGDPEEINAIDKVFCKNRTTPLKLGSIKSNLGHSEPASGLCSVAKVLIAMETGIIPPNLHYKRPREGIKALEEGRIQVITEPTPWEGGYVGINSFGFGGANAHILLKSNTKEKVNGGAPTDDLPRLVVVSGRTKEAVTVMLDDIDKHSVDVEYIRLIHDIYAESTSGHLYRGYTLVGYNDSKLPVREIEHFPGEKRPIWFVFSGMGSQWPGMGEDLMRLPIFAGTVKKCDAVLKPLGVNIYDILTSKDRKTFDNILNSFVGIAVVQIGLMDLLSCVGIVPDHIIGHSVGELGCAYADGCFTAEQMVLAAYYRGLASIETKVIYGCMAAVGLGYEALKDICPPDIEIACHNGPENSTISGPAESMKNFIASLQANNIFAKEVPCSNIPYHSRYIANAGPKLLAYLQKVIPEPKSRSPKWLSTSVPRTEWSSTLTQLSSAEYHTNNLLNPVLFAEIIALIPKNAITIEIAPHGLLQAILRNSLDPDIAKISLSQRNHKDNVKSLLQALGKLYNVGLQPQLAILYPPVEFPVSRSTPMISSNIRWEHSDDWYVTTYKIQEKLVSGERLVQVSLSDENLEFIAGHVIDGRNLFPAMGYIFLVWETIGMMRGQLFSEVSVVFEDITFLRATTVPKKGLVELLIMIQKGSGKFEIVEGDASVVTGVIRVSTDPMMLQQEMLHSDILPNEIENEDEAMSSGDIYKELKLRGYQYSGFFCGLQSATITGSKGHIRWMNNWVAFMDNMLQMQILSLDSRSLLVPTSIQKLIINPKVHMNHIRSISQEDKDLPVRVLKEFDIIISGGVEIRECRASSISRRKLMEKPVLEEYKFVAYRDREKINLREVLTLSCQIAVENVLTLTAKAIEIIDTDEQITNEQLVSPLILEILSDFPLIQANVILVAPSDKFDKESLSDDITLMEPSKIPKDANALLVVGSGLATKKNSDTLKQVLAVLKNDGFLLTRETTFNNEDLSDLQKLGLNIILEKRVAEESFILFRKKIKYPKKTIIIRLNNNEFSWLKEVQSVLDAVNDGNESIRAILLAEKDYESGLLGFINCLRREPSGEIFRGVLIQDNEGPEFSLENPFFDEQLQADLVINVLRYGNTWGSYRHLSLPTLDKQLVHHAYANQSIRGDLSSLCWYEGHIQEDNVSDNLVQIVYASLNFKDIMLATGKLSIEAGTKNKNIIECAIGIEYAGIDSSGRRIMGIQTNMCLSNLIVPDKHFYWEIPDRWSLEDGATIPCVYTTCYYALYMKSKIKKGDKILIHAGSGGIGQAAINLALYEGCEVFTTVGTEEKRAFIKKTFPSIDDDHIGNSRDTSFEQLILRQTKGRGVDIVLNSLAEEKLQASLRCLAEGGSFLEIGKFDFMMNNKLAMYVFLKDINFHSVMLDNMFTYETKSGVKYSLMKLVQKGISNGSIKPLVRTIFPKENLEKAFRFMAAGKHIGKIIIKVCDERKPLKEPMLAYPRFQCLKGRSYIIIGGLGGFALELADWLILRGAENLVLTSRSGIKNGYQRMRTELWKSYGINVLIIADRDCSNRDDCEYILQTANSLGPVDAIFNLAISLKDGICRNQTVENFEELFKSKVWNTKLLDKYSRIHCPYLRHFVVFSSISCGRGNAGQTNYGMGNSIMERICEKRVEEGLPGLAIQWGAIGDVGIIADMQANNKILETIGLLPQGIISCLQELDRFMKQSRPVVASMVLAEKRASGSGAKNVVEAVQNIMGLKDLKTISQHTPLAELGMDSMMAIEIKQTLEREFEIFLNAQDIRSLNFNKLIKMSENSTNQKNNEPVNSVQDETVLRGINLLVRSIGKEDFDFEPCINLETSIVDGKGEVFLIPGIEGYGSIFKNLLSYIKCPVTCLQLGINDNYKIVEDMAKYFLLYTLNKCKSTRNFAIVGYSFGTLIAIELVRRLEAEGLNGHLILIDGSPDQMKLLINQHLSDNNDVELQCKFLSALMDMLEPTRSLQLAATLHEYNTFEERLDEFLSCIPDNKHVKFSEENQKKFISVLYDRILAIKNYDPFSLPRIRSPIILLKPTLGNVQMSDEDYGLQKITQDKVQIHYVEGNHITVLDNPQIAKAINGESLEDAEAFKASIIGVGQVLTPLMADEHMRS